MSHYSAVTVATLLSALAACVDQPAGPPLQPEPKPHPVPLGVYEVTLSGLDGAGGALHATRIVPVPTGPSMAMNPVANGLALEEVSTSSFAEGPREEGGQRYISAIFRVRNLTGGPLTNLTAIPATSATTIPGTPFTELQLRSGGAANPAIAQSIVPSGAVSMGNDTRMHSNYPDVLQVFTEAEVAAIVPPAGVTGLFPYGFVVSNPATPASRTLPNAASDNDWSGLVTFAFRYPLQAAGAHSDPYSVTFLVVIVEDTETRMTESIEERQDTSGVRRAFERATALGATTVTVLAGSEALDPFETDYPGQRHICAVRTAGTPATPLTFITNPGWYTEMTVYMAGQSPDPCAAYFTVGDAAPAHYGIPYDVVVASMDRYGNVRGTPADTVTLTSTDGTAVMPPPFALSDGVAGVDTVTMVYTTYGGSTLMARGRRLLGSYAMFVNGMSRLWDGDVDTQWLTDGNWAEGVAPGAQDSVVIPGDRPNYPLLLANTGTFGVTMTSGTTVQPLIDLSLYDLTVAGDVDLGGTGTLAGTGRLILTGSGASVGGGAANFDVPDIRITETGRYSTSSNVTVTGGKIVVQGGRLRTVGHRIRVRPS
ncbi:MAG TPA: hypothetical protein VFT45_06835 [Longimicrobium sp.]|nr:hypothetical protein [Longimicrobium sp.]